MQVLKSYQLQFCKIQAEQVRSIMLILNHNQQPSSAILTQPRLLNPKLMTIKVTIWNWIWSKNLGLDILVGRLGLSRWWGVQAERHCRGWASAPDVARLVFSSWFLQSSGKAQALAGLSWALIPAFLTHPHTHHQPTHPPDRESLE